MIRRAPHRRHFVQVDNRAVEDPRLSLRAKGLLVYLLSRPDNWRAHPKQVAQTTSDSVGIVRSCLGELKRFGYAKLERIPIGKGRFGGTEWLIDELSIAEELSFSELQENRDSEKPRLGKVESRETAHLTILKEEQDEKENKVSFDFADATLQEEWEAWQQHRIEMHKPMTLTARGRAVMFLSGIGTARAIAAIRHSIQKGWTGIYEAPARDQQRKPMPYKTRQDKINALNQRKAQLLRMEQSTKVRVELEQIRIQLMDL